MILIDVGMQEEGDCTPCLGGYYCPLPGMVTPTDLCDEGYYCKQGARISAPDQCKLPTLCSTGCTILMIARPGVIEA